MPFGWFCRTDPEEKSIWKEMHLKNVISLIKFKNITILMTRSLAKEKKKQMVVEDK